MRRLNISVLSVISSTTGKKNPKFISQVANGNKSKQKLEKELLSTYHTTLQASLFDFKKKQNF